jgi:hypothetical protein
MELFATDHDRLAFLFETVATLDFETIEIQAGMAAEEPFPEQRPFYGFFTLNKLSYMKSKGANCRKIGKFSSSCLLSWAY